MIEVIKTLLYFEEHYSRAYAFLSRYAAEEPAMAVLAAVAAVNLLFLALRVYFFLLASLEKTVTAVVRAQLFLLRFSCIPLAVAAAACALHAWWSFR